VAELGCDAIQGYWLSRPLPPDELTDWLAGYEAGTAAD
jgi:EAL domain-containing protein (putative c-di-GMP-specific phosphodiesterase class I)